MRSESEVQSLIMIEAAKYGIRLMRNNSGTFKDETGRLVRFGLFNESKQQNEKIKSSDLIGIMPITGRFLAVECKKEGWHYTGTPREKAQQAFIDFVRSQGGLAGFAQSVVDFVRLIGRA